MAGISTFRAFSLVIAMISSIVVLALSVQTLVELQAVAGVGVVVHYANMGIAASVLALLSIPVMRKGSRPVILFELLWLSLLWILFFAAGGLTFTQANFSAALEGFSCDVIPSVELATVCKDAQPLGILSIVTALILFSYTLVLLIVTCQKSSRDGAVWKVSVKESETV
ncbi:hypothetical protein C8Q76DRAFT_789111 [Earliella scabrosa]|nr:hypothetical protein C8Q76DRAFT_789111 [Earliella scabrosa]